MDRAASRSVRISFEASLDACFAAASDEAAPAADALGDTRGRILTASCRKHVPVRSQHTRSRRHVWQREMVWETLGGAPPRKTRGTTEVKGMHK